MSSQPTKNKQRNISMDQFRMAVRSYVQLPVVQLILLSSILTLLMSSLFLGAGLFQSLSVDAGVICPAGYAFDNTVEQCAIIQANRDQCESGDTNNNDGTCTIQGSTSTYPASCPLTDNWVPYSATECYLGAGDLGYIIDDAGVANGSCLPDPVILGNTTTCIFPLTGSLSNTYFLPSSQLQVEIQGAGSSTNCGLQGNGSPAARISCTNVATSGSSLGAQTLSLDTGSGLQNKGQVLLVANELTTGTETEVTGFNPSDCATYPQSASYGTGDVCMVKLYERNGQFYSQINVPAGGDVNVRVYYNNTSDSILTNASFADEIPTGFTLNGQAQNTFVDEAVNVTVPSTGSFTLSPQAGFYGQADNLTSSSLEFGKSRYLNIHQCGYPENAASDGGASGDNHNDRFTFIDLGLSTFNSGTNVSNTTDTALACTSGDTSRVLNTILSNYQSFDLLGNQYLHLQQCVYQQNPGSPVAFQNDYSIILTPTINTNYSTSSGVDNQSTRTLSCGAGETGSSNRPLENTLSQNLSLDTFGNRYLHLHQCLYEENFGLSTFDQNDLSTLVDTSSADFGSTTVSSNSATHTPTCKTGAGDTVLNATYSGVQTLDLLDTSRGYGFLSYTMQADGGLAFDSTHGSNASLSATEITTQTDVSTNSIRIINEQGLDLESWWEVSDNDIDWSVSIDNISPRQTVDVRLWFRNNLAFPIQNAFLSATLPSALTLDTTQPFRICDVDEQAQTQVCSDDVGQSNANLNPALVTGQILQVSPVAGLNGNALDQTQGVLGAGELGYVQFAIENANESTGLVSFDLNQAGIFGDGVAFDRPNQNLDITYITSAALVCPYLQPLGGVRQAVVSDAELRTDQDFYCNYIAQICPVIFTDSNGNGVVDNGETVEDAQDVELLSADDGTVLDTLQSSTDGSVCFDGLLADENYRVRVVNPLDIISTTGGAINQYFVPFGVSTTTAYFGFSQGGILTLTVPNLVDFGDFTVASSDEVAIGNSQIVISDTRTTVPGWFVSCVVDQDFSDNNALAPDLTIANNFTAESLSIVEQGQSGNPAGITLGQRKTVTGFSDAYGIATANPSFGGGVYDNVTNLEYTLPAFTQVGDYASQITCTAI